MGQTKITARVAGAVFMIGLLAGCEGAVERRAGKRLAPDTPVVDAGLRTLARAHSQDGCDAGQVLTSPDPDATYGPGSIELTDRKLLDPAVDPPQDDYQATATIWNRFRTDPRLDATTWNRMAAGEKRCADGYLYMTLVLQSDGVPGFAPGVQRVTSGNAMSTLGGITTDGSTVAIRSQATDLAPGTTVEDIYLYDVATDTLHPTGVEPEPGWPRGIVFTADGSTVLYEEQILDPVEATKYAINALDVGSGSTTPRIDPGSLPVGIVAASSDGDEFVWHQAGGGGPSYYLSAADGNGRGFGSLSGFSFDISVSDDGDHASVVGGDADLYDRTTGAFTKVALACYADGPPTGTGLSADGRYLAYQCFDQATPAEDTDRRQDVFVWDRTINASTRITSGQDGRRTRGGSSISDDGRFVAFTYDLPTVSSGEGTYVWDRATGLSTLIAPVASKVAVSGDGGTVAFAAVAPGQTDPSITDLYVWENPAA